MPSSSEPFAPQRDQIKINGLSLRISTLVSDLWHRTPRSQPVTCSLTIHVPSFAAAASADDLPAGDSLDYSEITKALERKAVHLSSLKVDAIQETSRRGFMVDMLAHVLADAALQEIMKQVPASKTEEEGKKIEIELEVECPRARLSAGSVGAYVRRRTSALGLAPTHPVWGKMLLTNTSDLTEDRVVVKDMRIEMVIGMNDAERLERQVVEFDLALWAVDFIGPLEYAGFVPRVYWLGLEPFLTDVEQYLIASQPKTLEALATSLVDKCIGPALSFGPANSLFECRHARVAMRKPMALMFARSSEVVVERRRIPSYIRG